MYDYRSASGLPVEDPSSTVCPGNLKKFLHNTLRNEDGDLRFICAAPLEARNPESPPPEEAYRFLVNLPIAATVVGFRGRIVTSTKGQMDAWLNSSLPWDFSSASCTEDDYCLSQGGVAYPSDYLRSEDSGVLNYYGLEGRYVDGTAFLCGAVHNLVTVCIGLSLTVGEVGSRKHVFTLAGSVNHSIRNAIHSLLHVDVC